MVASLVGTHVGRISLEVLLGEGGMGEVYRGWDERLQRPVAVKTIRAEHRLSGRGKARFLREARLLSRIDHPGICRAYELVEGEDADFLVLELVDGETLRERAASGMEAGEAARIMALVADALEAAHSRGVVHRDLKPDNIMVTSNGAVKILDFGIARSVAEDVESVARGRQPASSFAVGLDETASLEDDLGGAIASDTFATDEGVLVGTARYMSPEQATGSAVGVSSDMYSLGIILHELVTGESPYGGAEGGGFLLRVAQARTEPLRGVDSDLADLIRRLETRDQRERPTAGETARSLRRFIERPVRRRRRWLRAVALVAVAVMVLVAAGVAVDARLRARRRAELAQRFGQTVERVSGLLWREHALPLHDTRPARRLVREKLEEIESAMEESGSVAVAPGHAALGRGFLSLGELDRARRHLETAWERGDHSPETAYGLGLALGKIYWRELASLERITEKQLRRQRLQQLQEGLREPALANLRRARGSDLVAPEYLDALIAMYDDRFDAALDLCREASDRVGWRYEAQVLEGRVHKRISDKRWMSGAYEEAMEAVDAAEDVLGRALRTGSSDPAVLDQRCLLLRKTAFHHLWKLGTMPEDLVDRALAACSASVTAHPDRALPHVQLAELYSDWGEYLQGHGEDPAAKLDAAEDAVERALLFAPDSERALDVYVMTTWQRGKYLMDQGLDPVPTFDAGIATARRILTEHPDYVWVGKTLGFLLLDRSLWRLLEGHDPRPDLRQARLAFARMARAVPGTAEQLVNQGICWQLHLQYEVRQLGHDPRQAIREAVETLDEALELNPELYWTHRTLGAVLTHAAEADRLHGRDASEHLPRAVDALKRAVQINPHDSNNHYYLADALLGQARCRIDAGLDPERSLDRALECLRECAARCGVVSLPTDEACAHRLRARWESENGRSPLPALNRAEELIGDFDAGKAGEENGTFDDRLLLAEILIARAEWLEDFGRNLDPTRELRLCNLVSNLASRRPDHIRVRLLGARLDLLQARRHGDQAGVDTARENLRRMATELPGLRPELEELLG